MKFQFVNNNGAVDGAARKQIRSHVAMGRNAGRKLSRPSRKKLLTARTTTTSTAMSPLSHSSPSALPAHWQQHQDAGSESLALIQGAAAFFSSFRHAPELDTALDYSLYSPTLWVQPLFVNEAYFHGAMAVFMTAFPTSNHGRSNQADRVRHICLAIRLVNARLSGRDAVSNETVMVVLSLGLYERFQGEYHRGLVHLEGLVRMIDLRGGIREFSTSRPDLARKVFRTDVEYSIHLGRPTRFSPNDAERVITPNPLETTSPPPRSSPELHKDNHPMATLLRDATHTANLLNAAAASPPTVPKLDSHAVHDAFIMLGYRVQALSPLLSGNRTVLMDGGVEQAVDVDTECERMVCIGLTAFVASFFWGGGCGNVNRGPLGWVMQAVRGLRNWERGERWEGEVFLWMLFVGIAAEVFEDDSVGWMSLKMREVLGRLGLEDWGSVVRVLKGFPWVEALHGRRGYAHFERCMGVLSSAS